MIKSLQKIEHVQEDGTITVLLDFGDFIEDEIEIGADQQSTGFNPIGAEWGLATSEGGARRSFTFTRRQEHASHTEARSYSIYNPATRLFGKQGAIRVSIREADDAPVVIWLLESAIVQSSNPRPMVDARGFRSLTTYQITSGRSRPLQGSFGQCYPIGMQTYQIGTDETPIGSDECEIVPPYEPEEPNPGTPPSLVPEGHIPGFTVSGITIPSSYNGHFSFSGYSFYGERKWNGPSDSVVYRIPDEGYSLGPLGEEPQFYSTNNPEYPWLATWAPGLGTGTIVLTVDP